MMNTDNVVTFLHMGAIAFLAIGIVCKALQMLNGQTVDFRMSFVIAFIIAFGILLRIKTRAE